jgi:c-di-AMP phosphodiesterase-like protein
MSDLKESLEFAQYVAENLAQILVIIMLHHDHDVDGILSTVLQAFPPTKNTPEAMALLDDQKNAMRELIEETQKNLDDAKQRLNVLSRTLH